MLFPLQDRVLLTSQAFSETIRETLGVVYLKPAKTSPPFGGFFVARSIP